MAAPTPTYTATEDDSLDSPSLGSLGDCVVVSVEGALVVVATGLGLGLGLVGLGLGLGLGSGQSSMTHSAAIQSDTTPHVVPLHVQDGV